MSRRYNSSAPTATATVQNTFQTRWETDFANTTTYPSNTVYGANGTYAITPSSTGSAANWIVANFANSSKFQITSGTGLEITNNTTSSGYTNAALRTAPIISSAITELYPGASFAQTFRLWVRLTGNFVRATDACRAGFESGNSGVIENYGAAFGFVAGGKQAFRSQMVNSTYAAYGDGANITAAPDVLMLEWQAGGFFNAYYGTWSAGWPVFTAMTLLSGSGQTAMGTPSPGSYTNRIKLISDLRVWLNTESVNVTGGNAMIVKNLRLQSFGDP